MLYHDVTYLDIPISEARLKGWLVAFPLRVDPYRANYHEFGRPPNPMEGNMKSKKLMILFVCFVMMATVAAANEAPTATRIDPADLQNMTALIPTSDGIVGNC